MSIPIDKQGNILDKKNKIHFCYCCKTGFAFKSELNRHNNTKQHIKRSIFGNNGNEINQIYKNTTNDAINIKKNKCCLCNKEYKDNSGLWKHKKKCFLVNKLDTRNKNEIIKLKDEIIKVKEDMLMIYINQNKEFHTFMLEQMKLIQEKQTNEQLMNHTIAINNNSNNNNKTFNLQFFLNETCKDAMNLSDFVNNIKIEVDDLIDSPIGYVKCITSQFMKFYKQLPIEKRPFHCSDEKRKSLHIKENGEWIIDDCEDKIRKVVKCISHKNICRLVSWKKIHLDYSDPESVTNTQYISIIQNCCAGNDDFEIEKNEMKVVFNLIKESVIDKKRYINNNNTNK
jgi:hypothetical protein